MSTSLTRAPLSSNADDSDRWKHTRDRRKMLRGLHRDLIETELIARMGGERASAQGGVDLSSNILKSGSAQLAVLHDREPIITGGDTADEYLGDEGALKQSGWAPLMCRFSADVIGMRENLMRLDATEEGEFLLRPAPPDHVEAEADPDRPDIPVVIREVRPRRHPETKKEVWFWDVLDISDPEAPTYAVHEMGKGNTVGDNVSGAFGITGEYPYRWEDGKPFLPYTLYHASKLGDRLWDPWEASEVYYGTIQGAISLTFTMHCMQDASWPQRYGVDVEPIGTEVKDAGGKQSRTVVQADPAAIILFRSIKDSQPILDQFANASDPAAMMTATMGYLSLVAEHFGITTSDKQNKSGNARSGYAISLTNEAKREAQRKFTPQFRVGDLELISKGAALLNRFAGTKYPETGYTIEYPAIPLSGMELEAMRKDLLEKMEAGLTSPVDAYMELHPGTSRKQAKESLTRIRIETGTYGAIVV